MSASSEVLKNRYRGTRMKLIGALQDEGKRLALLAQEIGDLARQAHGALSELQIESTHVVDFRHLKPLPRVGVAVGEPVSAFCFMGSFIENGIIAFFLEPGGASPSLSPNLSVHTYVSSTPITIHTDWYEAAHDDPDRYFYKLVGGWRPERGEFAKTIRLDADAPARINEVIMETAAACMLERDVRNIRITKT